MKKIFFALTFAILPFSLYAEEITVNMNVRYQSSLIFSGPVTLTKSSTSIITDTAGVTHSISSDSALAALSIAATSSNDFYLSDLIYYGDYDSFFIKCINIQSLSQNACNNWKYVVNSAYPPMGSDKYILADGDTIYFYFGNAHKLSLSANEIKTDIPVTVKTELYDYTSDSWITFPNTLIGATQPNPNDPYSPLVLLEKTTNSDGLAELLIGTPGTYSVGIASDYYNPAEQLIVSLAEVKIVALEENKPVDNTPPSSSHRRNLEIKIQPTEVIQESLAKMTTTIEKEIDKNQIMLDIPIGDFVDKYNEALKGTDYNKTILTAPKKLEVDLQPINNPTSQAASVIEAVENLQNKTPKTHWFNKLLKLFGI